MPTNSTIVPTMSARLWASIVSVAMPEDLLVEFDKLVATRGLAKNRSEVVRDLVREALAGQASGEPGEEVMGTLTIVFNHHASDVREKLDSIQHDCLDQIITSVHVHIDHELCMEVVYGLIGLEP